MEQSKRGFSGRRLPLLYAGFLLLAMVAAWMNMVSSSPAKSSTTVVAAVIVPPSLPTSPATHTKAATNHRVALSSARVGTATRPRHISSPVVHQPGRRRSPSRTTTGTASPVTTVVAVAPVVAPYIPVTSPVGLTIHIVAPSAPVEEVTIGSTDTPNSSSSSGGVTTTSQAPSEP